MPCAATVVYSIPCVGVHRRTGQQVSGTARLCDPVRERANKVFGKRSARLLKFVITARLPGRSAGPKARRLQRRLLRPVIANVVVNNIGTATATATATSSTTDRYVLRDPICWLNMFTTYMFSVSMLLFMLVNASSMFEINMLVAIVVMLNILELIMKLLPNYSTSSAHSHIAMA